MGSMNAVGNEKFARVKQLWQRWQTVWLWIQRLRPYRAFSHFTNVGGSVLTSGMSYLAIFAVFAALAVGFGVFGYELRQHPDFLSTLVEQINGFVPGLLGYGDTKGAVEVETLLAEHVISATTLVAGVSLLWVTMSWFTGTRRSIRIIFELEVRQYRNAALLKLRDLMLAVIFAAALILSAILTVISTNLFDDLFAWLGWDSDNWLLNWMGQVVRYGAVYVFDVLLLLAMHVLLAEVRLPFWRMLSGCLIGGAALSVLKVLGTTLLSGSTSNPLLATFSVIIGLLIWFNLICRALLLTSSWIATGLDKHLGEPDQQVVEKLEASAS